MQLSERETIFEEFGDGDGVDDVAERAGLDDEDSPGCELIEVREATGRLGGHRIE
jgi:hypothetical protein